MPELKRFYSYDVFPKKNDIRDVCSIADFIDSRLSNFDFLILDFSILDFLILDFLILDFSMLDFLILNFLILDFLYWTF